MRERRKPEVGETLFLVDSGNRLRRTYSGKQRECVVTKVGCKYFSIEYDGWAEIQFYIKTWSQNTDYLADFILYESRQEWEDKALFQKMKDALKNFFDYYSVLTLQQQGITLEQLKKVVEILNINIDEV